MRKTLLLLLTTFFLSGIALAQTQLVIEVTTDNYPDETYWKVYDLNNTVIKQSGVLLKQTTHRDTLIINGETCYYWTIYDKYSDGMSSAGGGDYKVYLDGSLFAQCENPNFGDSISVYNLGAACVPNDAALLYTDMLYYISKEPQYIQAALLNMGKEPITSVEASYKVNDVTSETKTISGLNIPVGGIVTIAHPDIYDFNQAGVYQIEFILTKVNESIDATTVNNTCNKEVMVLDGTVRKNMVEMVTSAYCPSCPEANALVEGTLFPQQGTFSLVKYIPSWWGDLKYVTGTEHRLDIYNVRGAPYVFLNGTEINWMAFTPETYENYLGEVSEFKIGINSFMRGDSIFATIAIKANETITGSFSIRGLAVQYLCHENTKGSDYYYPVYGYLPDPEGIQKNNFIQGETYIYHVAGSIREYPFETGSLQDMIVMFYVQNNEDRTILQTENIPISYSVVPPVIAYNIENGATDIDTSGLIIEATSNRNLLNIDGRLITTIKDHIVFRKDAITGAAVPFTATIDSLASKITIKPVYGWTPNSTYYLLLKNFATLDEVVLPNDTLVFTTLAYIGVNDKIHKAVNAYPTIAESRITIESNTLVSLQICNMVGQVVDELNGIQGKYVLPINHYTNGVYFIKVKDTLHPQIIKFLKK